MVQSDYSTIHRVIDVMLKVRVSYSTALVLCGVRRHEIMEDAYILTLIEYATRYVNEALSHDAVRNGVRCKGRRGVMKLGKAQ